jgi:hypothetical protein
MPKAYDVRSENAASHASTANKLLKNPQVSALVDSVWHVTKESLVNDAIATRRHVMEQLLKHSEDAKQEGTKLKALELMGRAVGMFTDKVEQTGGRGLDQSVERRTQVQPSVARQREAV